MSNAKDITGKKVGLLTAVRPTDERYHKSAVWEFLCDCGNRIDLPLLRINEAIRKNNHISCGCYIGSWQIKHGSAKRNGITKEYRSWICMRQRCQNTNRDEFHYYGGRGISVCERWNSSFELFIYDMGKCPGKKYSIDRINIDGNYEPGNCRWATKTTQAINRRKHKNNTSGVVGVTRTQNGRWIAQIKINRKMIRLGRFRDILSAIEARKSAEMVYFSEHI